MSDGTNEWVLEGFKVGKELFHLTHFQFANDTLFISGCELRKEILCPPFLFLLVVNILSRIVGKCVDGSVITPFQVGEDRIPLSHLQFADDGFFLGDFWFED